MKNKIVVLLTALMTATLLVACGSSNVAENAETALTESSTVAETTEAPHEHNYTEVITTEATCEADGVKTFTCECGDSYTEPITATGHIFETYASNNDATFTADGTETAKCNGCDVTDTRTAEGSMLTYTYTDMDATMYAQQTVNVRSMPSTDGEKLGGLSTNDEVKVTGQCAETSWYRIEYNGNVAYVSNNYLGADKVVVQASASADASGQKKSGRMTYDEAVAYALSLGYPVNQAVDNGDGTATYYHLYANEVLSGEEREKGDKDYMAARDAASAITAQYSSDFYEKETSGHYATLDDRWTVRWRTTRRVPNL